MYRFFSVALLLSDVEMKREIRSQNQQMKIANNGQPKGRKSEIEMPTTKTSAIKTKVQLILKQKQINVIIIIINEEVYFFSSSAAASAWATFRLEFHVTISLCRCCFFFSSFWSLCIETKLDKSTQYLIGKKRVQNDGRRKRWWVSSTSPLHSDGCEYWIIDKLQKPNLISGLFIATEKKKNTPHKKWWWLCLMIETFTSLLHIHKSSGLFLLIETKWNELKWMKQFKWVRSVVEITTNI